MNLQTHLLAVKLFRPYPSLGKITGKVVMKWLRQVLAQHGLRLEDIAGAVTDAGCDVRNGVAAQFSWEWCISHLGNRATIDGTGKAQTLKGSKNIPGRELLEEVGKIVEHFNKSSADKVFYKLMRCIECQRREGVFVIPRMHLQ